MHDISIDTPFCLDEVEIRPALNEIEGPGGLVRINPKAMEVLVELARHAKSLRSKRDLLDAVWTGSAVGDEVLSNAVWELRRALKESARKPRFIQTVPRKGYRLAVQPVLGGAEQLRPSPTGRFVEEVRRRRWLLAVIVVVIVIVVLTAINELFLATGHDLGPTARSSEIRSLVVLPFDAVGEDRRDQHLAEALSGSLITALAKVDELKVITRATALSYQERQATQEEIAEELDVDAVVEGNLAREGQRLVVDARLVELEGRRLLWAETYERRFTDLLDLQVELARSISAGISPFLVSSSESPRSEPRPRPVGDSLLRWTFPTGCEVWSSPVSSGAGEVLFGGGEGRLYSVSLADGSETWRARVGDRILTQALVIGDRVVAAAADGMIVAVALGSGDELWRYDMGGAVESRLVEQSAQVIAATEAGEVRALDVTSGRSLWSWVSAASVDGLASGQSRVAVSGFDGVLTLLDGATGQLLWQARVGEWLTESAAIYLDQVLIPSPDGSIVALDLMDGRQLWSFRAVSSSSVIGWRDRVLSGGEGGVVRALEAETGQELWRFEALDATTRPSVHDETVYVGSRDGNLYALDAWSGALLWRIELGTWVTTPATEIDGALVFASLDGTVLCVDPPVSSSVVIRQSDGFRPRQAAGDERRRGFEIVCTADGSHRPEVRWRFRGDGPMLHRPVLTESFALASGHEVLTAVDLETGDPRWQARLPGQAGAGPALAGSRAVVGTRSGSVVAYDVESGSELWRSRTGGAVVSTPTAADGAVLVGSRDGFLYKLDPSDGQEIWRRQLDIIHASPLVIDDEIWVPSRGDRVWVLSTDDGQVLDSIPTADWVVADPVAGSDQVLLAACDGTVASVHGPSRARLWSYATTGEIWYRPAILGSRYLFGSADHHVYAIDVTTGEEVWRRRTQGPVLSSVASWRDLVLVGSHDRSLHALDQRNGELQWRLVTTGAVGSPVVHGDLLAVGSQDCYLYLVELR